MPFKPQQDGTEEPDNPTAAQRRRRGAGVPVQPSQVGTPAEQDYGEALAGATRTTTARSTGATLTQPSFNEPYEAPDELAAEGMDIAFTTKIPGIDIGQKQFNYKSPLTASIEVIERSTKQTLSTDVVMDLAGLGENQEDVARISRILARDLSFPPRYLFGDVPASQLVNEVTGEPYTIAEMRTMSDQFKPVAIASMLEDASVGQTGRGRGGAGTFKRDAGQIGKLAHVLAQAYPGMPAGLGIAMATALYDQGVKPQRLLRSANGIRAYMQAAGMPDTPEVFAPLAATAAAGKKPVGNSQEVVEALFGKDGKVIADRINRLFEAREVFTTAGGLKAALDTAPSQRTEAQTTALEAQNLAGIEGRIDAAVEPYGETMKSLNPELWGEIKAIEKEVAMRDQAFERTWYGQLLHGADYTLDRLQLGGYRALVDISTPIVIAERFARAGLDENIQLDSLVEDVLAERRTINERLNTSLEKFGTPMFTYAIGVEDEWYAPFMEFFVAWYADPLNVIGRAAMMRNLRRVAPGLLDKQGFSVGVATRILNKVDDEQTVARFKSLGNLAERYNNRTLKRYSEAVQDFAKSDEMAWVWKGIGKPEVYNARVRAFKGVYEGKGLDVEFMSVLRDAVLQRHGSFNAAALEDFRHGVIAHLNGGWAPPGSAANLAIARRYQLGEDAEKALLDLADGSLTEADVIAKYGHFFDPDMEQVVLQGRLEIPTVTRRGRLKAANVENNPTSIIRRELNLNPGRTINIEDNPTLYVRYNMERAGVPEEVIGDFEQRMARAATSAKGREDKFAQVVKEMDEAIFDHKLDQALGKATITPEARAQMKGDILDPFHSQMAPPKRAFAIVPAELDNTVPKTIDGLNRAQRQAVRKTLLGGAKDSERWKSVPYAERKILERQLKKWVAGTGRPTQEEWLAISTLRDSLKSHLSQLARWEDDIRDTVNHSLLTGEERLAEVAARWGPDFAARVSRDLADGKWVGKYGAGEIPPQGLVKPGVVPGEDIDALVQAIIRHEPDGGILKYALEHPKVKLWEQHGALATVVEEIRSALGNDKALIAYVLGDAETTRDILANVKKVLKWDNPFPLHPWQVADRMGVDVDLLDPTGLREAMGIPPTRVVKDRPISPTQLQNTLTVPDPIDIENRIKQWIGAPKLAAAKLSKETVITGEAASAQPFSTANAMKDLGRGYRRIFKFMALAVSPTKYTMKVTLGDNNFRFLFIRGLGERLLAQRTFGRLAERTGLWNTKVLDSAGNVVADVVPSGSLRYAREPLAGNHLRMSELTDEISRDVGRQGKGGATLAEFDEITPQAKNHLGSWVGELNNTFLGSEPGTIILQGIRDGRPFDDVVADVQRWGEGVGRNTVTTRMGIAPDNIRQWAHDFTASGHYYTVGKPEIANAVLQKMPPRTLRKHLDRIVPMDERPNVNGAVAGKLTRESAATRYVNWSYRRFVSGPDDALIRQPVFRSYKRGADLFYRRDLARKGAKVTPDVERAIDRATTRFALDNVNRTMFDATKQQRFMEHMGVFFPFPQPFFENFTAWAHIAAYRNPSTISHLRQIWTLGKNTGVIQQDENGEWIIPFHPVQGAVELLSLLPGLGGLERFPDMSMRLGAFNMASQSSIDIFGTPIPAPGMDPFWTSLFQNMLKDSTNDAAVSYLFQFGSSTSLLPKSAESVFEVLSPEAFAPERIENLKLWVARDMQFKGLDRDEDGNPLPLTTLEEMAEHTARELASYESAARLFGPTTGKIQWEFQDKLDELKELRDTLGFLEGTQAFNDKYDYAYSLMTVGTTEYTDPSVERELGEEVPRIPGSEFVAKLKEQPHAKEFMQQYPGWFSLLLVGADPETANAFSPAYYSRQYEQGFLTPKTFVDFVSEGEQGPAWASYMAWRDGPGNVLYEAWQREGGNTESYLYTRYQDARIDKLTDMSVQFPSWADQYLTTLGENGDMDFAYGDPDKMPKQIVYDQARAIIAQDDLRGVPGVEALRYYITERDKLAAVMDKRGYSDIRQPSAEEDGLTARLEQINATVENLWPEASPLISTYFEGDLTNMTTEQLETYRGPLGPSVARIDKGYREFDLNKYDFEFQYYGNLQERAEYLNRIWVAPGPPNRAKTMDRQALEKWWATEYPPGSPKRREYMQALAFKEPTFLSAFDHHLLGVDLSPAANSAIEGFAAARYEISKAENQDIDFDSGAAYDAISAVARAESARLSALGDDSLKNWVEATNRWGYGLEAAGLTKGKDKASAAWQDVYDTLGAVQAWADANDLHGTAYSQDYNAVRNTVLSVIKTTYMSPDSDRYSKRFVEQWNAVNEGGRSVIQTLMPDTYYRLG